MALRAFNPKGVLMSIHAELRGANVHQPKGAEGASNGQVIQATGGGTTSWVDLFIREYLPLLVIEAIGSYTPNALTDETGVETIPTAIKPLNEGVTDKDAVTNENFAAVTAAINNCNAYLTENGVKVATDINQLSAKINAVITLLQNLNIARETY